MSLHLSFVVLNESNNRDPWPTAGEFTRKEKRLGLAHWATKALSIHWRRMGLGGHAGDANRRHTPFDNADTTDWRVWTETTSSFHCHNIAPIHCRASAAIYQRVKVKRALSTHLNYCCGSVQQQQQAHEEQLTAGLPDQCARSGDSS